MQPDRTPVTLLLAVIVFDIVFGVAVLRDVFVSSDGLSRRKQAVSTAASAPPESKAVKKVPEKTAAPAVAPVAVKEPSTVKTAEETVNKAQQGTISVAPSEKSIQRSKAAADLRLERSPGVSQGTTKSLRTDDAGLPTSDLRSGTDTQPMGSLRNPAESNVTGSLRPDEPNLPSGSLRQDERSLPTGNLR